MRTTMTRTSTVKITVNKCRYYIFMLVHRYMSFYFVIIFIKFRLCLLFTGKSDKLCMYGQTDFLK